MDGRKENRQITKQEEIPCKQRINKANFLILVGSIMSARGGSNAEMKQRILQAQCAYGKQKNIWLSSQIRQITKIKMSNRKVQSVFCFMGAKHSIFLQKNQKNTRLLYK